jgi:hypothetical protein
MTVLAAAALLTASMVPFAKIASAMPIGDALAIKNAAPTNSEMVQFRHRGRGWGFGAGLGAGILGGAIVGGLLANPYYYGPGPYYPAPYYPAPDSPEYGGPPPGNAVAYCMQRFKSYDPGTGTYLGYDGVRHPCP